jgi:HEAT repeats/Putative zinc-finger
MNCDWVKENVALYLYNELGDDARHEMEQHANRCEACAEELETVRAFQKTMSAMPQLEVNPNLLTQARMELQEALETTTQARGWARFALDPMAWVRQARFSPALAAVLLMVGFGGGVGATYQMVKRPAVPVEQPQAGAEQAAISGVRNVVQEPGSNKVSIEYDRTMPGKVQGSMDDPNIQNLLLMAARTNYNSGVRMDSIDLLKQKPDDGRVREGLIFSLRYDSNPGVRLKALEALQGQVKQDIRVRNAMLEALLNDNNPGVRTGAMKALEQVKADTSVRQALQQLAKDDPNAFIRSESRRVLATVQAMD